VDLVGREEGERSKRGRGVGEGGIPLQVARFSEELWFRVILLVGVLNLNLNLLLVITDNVY